MKDWLKRHISLSRHEQLLISGILLVLISLLILRYSRVDSPEKSIRDPAAADVN